MTRDEFLALASARYQELQALEKSPTLYDYEKSLREIGNALLMDIMREQLGGKGNNRRKKKS